MIFSLGRPKAHDQIPGRFCSSLIIIASERVILRLVGRLTDKLPNLPGEFKKMEYVPTPWPLFVAIVLGMTALTFLLLGGKKAFFEPYNGPDEN